MAPRKDSDERNPNKVVADRLNRRRETRSSPTARGGPVERVGSLARGAARRLVPAGDQMGPFLGGHRPLTSGERSFVNDRNMSGPSVLSPLDQILADLAARRAAAMAGQQLSQGDFAARSLSAPSLDSYIAPYLQAEEAAKGAHEVGTAEIQAAAERHLERLAQTEAQYSQEQAQASQAEAAHRAFFQAQLDQALTPSTLAQELGAAPGLEAEAGLIQALAQQANQAQDELNTNMQQSQAQQFVDRTEGAQQSEANSLAVAQNNLSALLQQIGLGKAQAEQQYNQDLNSVEQANAQAADQARRQWMEYQAAQQQGVLEDLAFQEQLVGESTVHPWEQKFDSRARQYPKAMNFFQNYLDTYAGTERLPENRQAAIAKLPDALAVYQEATGTKLNPQIITEWINEYYSTEGGGSFDANRFRQLGGDSSLIPAAKRRLPKGV